jgi:hypothetical protein
LNVLLLQSNREVVQTNREVVWTFTFKLVNYILLKQKLVFLVRGFTLKLLMKRFFRKNDEILVN